MRWFRARAKVNLALHIRGRRTDGYHELESLVAFAGACDWLGYESADVLALDIVGSNADLIGPVEDNLVLRAARDLASRVEGLKLGRFTLMKVLPAAAGLGGGSADAAAALMALADANGLTIEDDRVKAAAAATGADVPVCLMPTARVMAGIGEEVGPPVAFPCWFILLANPRVQTPTKNVFRIFDGTQTAVPAPPCPGVGAPVTLASLTAARNDLEPAALEVAPVIDDVLAALKRLPGARLVRMSGSGATCFALFDRAEDAVAGQLTIAAAHPRWWVSATTLR